MHARTANVMISLHTLTVCTPMLFACIIVTRNTHVLEKSGCSDPDIGHSYSCQLVRVLISHILQNENTTL